MYFPPSEGTQTERSCMYAPSELPSTHSCSDRVASYDTVQKTAPLSQWLQSESNRCISPTPQLLRKGEQLLLNYRRRKLLHLLPNEINIVLDYISYWGIIYSTATAPAALTYATSTAPIPRSPRSLKKTAVDENVRKEVDKSSRRTSSDEDTAYFPDASPSVPFRASLSEISGSDNANLSAQAIRYTSSSGRNVMTPKNHMNSSVEVEEKAHADSPSNDASRPYPGFGSNSPNHRAMPEPSFELPPPEVPGTALSPSTAPPFLLALLDPTVADDIDQTDTSVDILRTKCEKLTLSNEYLKSKVLRLERLCDTLRVSAQCPTPSLNTEFQMESPSSTPLKGMHNFSDAAASHRDTIQIPCMPGNYADSKASAAEANKNDFRALKSQNEFLRLQAIELWRENESLSQLLKCSTEK